MAGGFNGDDEDYDYYDDDEEEVYDDGEEDDEEDVDDEETEEDDEEEDEKDTTDNMNALQKKLFEWEEKRLKPKLQKILEKLRTRNFPYYTPFEKRDIEKAKKHPKLKTDVTAIDLQMGLIRTKFTSKAMSAIAPAVPFIIFGLLFLLILCVIVAFVGSIMPWLFPDDETAGGGNGSGSGAQAAFGVNGKDFYGVRTIYKNDEKARASLLQDYSTLIEDVRENLLAYTKTITREEDDGSGGKTTKTYNVYLEVKLSDIKNYDGEEPTDYDFSSFDEVSFSSTYNDYYTVLLDISEAVRVVDNPTGNVVTSLQDKLNEIKYFGFNNSLINTTETESSKDVDDVLVDYFTNPANYTLKVKNTEGIDVSASVTLEDAEKITAEEIKAEVNEIANALTLTRAEKLFVKDYVFSSESDMMKGITKENYVTWIFMPKNAVQFSKISFYVTHTDFNNFSIKLFNNGSEISLSKEDVNMGDESNPTYGYIANNINVGADVFTDINSGKLDALSTEISLAEIISNQEINTDTYLETSVEGFYTYKKNGVYVEFTSEIDFRCVEFETLWSARG